MWPINRGKRPRLFRSAFAVFAAVAFAVSGCGDDKDGGEAANAIVATYKEGGKVTRAEYDKFVGTLTFFQPLYAQFETDPAFQEQMIKQMVAFRLLGEQADEQSKKEADEKTKEQIDQLTAYFAQFGTKDTLKQQLQQANLTTEDLEQYIRQSLIVLGDAEKKVKEEDMKAKYDENLKNSMYDIATVSHILISLTDDSGKEVRTKEQALARANEVKQKLDAGGDFAALAKEYSDDPGSKDNGGKYENEMINNWVEGFKNAAKELPLNTISDPVETEFGYHVMKVESRSTLTYDEVKEELKAELAESRVMDFIENELPNYLENIDTSKLPQASASPEVPAPETSAGGAGGQPAQ